MRAFYRKYHNIIETMLLLCILAGGFYWKYQEYRMQQTQQQIAEKILRFHVRANSNSRADQALKLKVRDAVGAYMQQQLDGVQDIRECSLIVQENLAQVIKTAQQAVAQEGYDYSVDARIETVAFPQKTYGNYTFPAGDYQALNVIIGSGKGQNWWCVMFPPLCIPAAATAEEGEGPEALREIQLLNEEPHYRLAFASVEWVEECLASCIEEKGE